MRQHQGSQASCSIELTEGELGWASYECREAKSEILYFAHTGRMPSHRWPKAILDAMGATNNFSKAYFRIQKLWAIWIYECDAMLELFPRKCEWKMKEGVESESSLEGNRQFRTNRGTIDHVYENSRRSTRLAGARVVFLNTNSVRARFEGGEVSLSSVNTTEKPWITS